MDNRISIEVFGSVYVIKTNEAPDYVKQLGGTIDEQVRDIMQSNAASLPQALVLLTINYLDKYKKAEEGADHLREQVAEYLEEATQARLELTNARAEIERLNRDHQLKMDET